MNILLQTWAVIGPYAITGAVVSLIVQFTKSFFAKSAHKLLWAIVISILGGVVLQFVYLIPTNWFGTIVAVLASANTVYLVVIQWFESDTPAPAVTASVAATS
jgi:hypothetical protein